MDITTKYTNDNGETCYNINVDSNESLNITIGGCNFEVFVTDKGTVLIETWTDKEPKLV